MWKFVLICSSLAASALVAADSFCSGDCKVIDGTDNHYCEADCYADSTNLICTCETQFGGGIKCTDADGAACAGTDASTNIETDEDCRNLCYGETFPDCVAYIWDQNFSGPRCQLSKACQTLEEAQETTPCSDCQSGKKCSTCPTLVYQTGSTAIHYICGSAGGDAYHSSKVEGTTCTPTHMCEELKYTEIACVTNDQGTGVWMGTMRDDTTEEVKDNKADVLCTCSDLVVPKNDDTNLFCSNEPESTDQFWTLKSDSDCQMVCDGTEFLSLACKFADVDDGTAWHVTYRGQDNTLAAATTCFACSLSSCDGFTTPSPTEPSSSAAPTESTAAPTESTAAPTESTAAPTEKI